MDPKNLPNLITALRLVLMLPMIWLLANGYNAAALGLLALMGLSDAVDGYLAKRYHWRSTLGEYLDPLADKVMLVGTYITLGWLGTLPAWLVATVILRDMVIVAGAVAYHFVTHQLAMQPTLLSKANTSAQIVLALAVLLDQFLSISDVVIAALIVIVLLTTVASGLDYVLTWSRRTRAAVRGTSD